MILIQELDKLEGDGDVRSIKRNLEKNKCKNNSYSKRNAWDYFIIDFNNSNIKIIYEWLI